MTTSLVIGNNKGGQGRTTTSISLADNLARKGKRVLVWDCDPDMHTTYWLGYSPDGMTTIYDVLTEPKRGFAQRGKGPVVSYTGSDARKVAYPGKFDLLVGSPKVLETNVAFERTLTSQPPEAQVYKKVVWYLVTTFCRDYDYVIFDTTSLHGPLAEAILAAAQWIIISMQVEAMSKRGVLNLIPTIKATNASRVAGDELRIAGLLGCKVPIDEMGAAETFFNGLPRTIPYFRTMIPYSYPAHEAPESNLPISVFAPGDVADVAYANLVKELEARIHAA